MHAAENVDRHSHHPDLIAKALATEGGHLSIGRGCRALAAYEALSGYLALGLVIAFLVQTLQSKP